MKWLKLIWLRIRYMQAYNNVIEALNQYSIKKPTEAEKQIIFFLCSVGHGTFAIANVIVRGRTRSLVIGKLKEIGISESLLSDSELKWLEELLDQGDSIDDMVKKIQEQRTRSQKLPTPSPVKNRE
jgi:hypothetical protein